MEADAVWPPAPGDLALPGDEVHVWRAPLDLPPTAVAALRRLLAPDERERADRFHFEHDRRHFIAARGTLRLLLGRYLRTAPEQLSFAYNPYGKPDLAAGPDPPPLRFNVSHSHGLALYAVTLDRRLGVDVEYMRPDIAVEQIAEHFFSPGEVRTLRALPSEVRRAAFFACWTRKEAYIKGQGQGLSIPLDGFDVAFAPGTPAALLRTRHDPTAAAHWRLHNLPAGAGYAAAVAVEGQNWRLRCFEWPMPPAP